MTKEKKSENTEKINSKRDLLILSASFTFTLLIAGLVLNHTKNERQKCEIEIKKLIHKLVQEKFDSIPKSGNYYERKNDQLYDDENARSKRAIREFQYPSSGIIFN